MSITVCFAPATIDYPAGGGHFWAYLNWALGLRALGCNVLWLESVIPNAPRAEIRAKIDVFKNLLERYGFVNCLALHCRTDETLPRDITDLCMDLDAVTEADLLLELRYNTPSHVVKRFRRSALVDLDPGLLQTWMNNEHVSVAPHDVYFTIGETVGQPGMHIPDGGIKWVYTPPCVALDFWPTRKPADGAAFTTVAHWYAGAWVRDEAHLDDKRSGFQMVLDLPRFTRRPLELALDLNPQDNERIELEKYGWRVADAHVVAATPWDYQSYIQNSFGEFSCAKPSYVTLGTAWVSDRTLCYLASGKPAVVQHTGPSCFLPDAAGLFRFRDMKEAICSIENIVTDYEKQSKLARNLAEEYFDARKVLSKVLERALS